MNRHFWRVSEVYRDTLMHWALVLARRVAPADPSAYSPLAEALAGIYAWQRLFKAGQSTFDLWDAAMERAETVLCELCERYPATQRKVDKS